MRRFISPRLVVVLVLAGACAAAVVVSAQRSSRVAASMATAANNFLASLTPAQRQQATFAFEGAERLRWHFVPQFERNGLQIKAMTEPQRRLAHELLKTGLSTRGYTTYTEIMELENILKVVENGNGPTRDPEAYRFSIFGTPSATGTWGWRVEFHHVSLHFTVADGTMVVAAPTFWGTNPAEVREGPRKGFRTLDKEQDAGRALVMALDDAQKKTATFAEVAPTDILTKTDVVVNPLDPPGIAASAMTAKQRELLMQLIDVYTGQMTADIAAERQTEYKKAGIEKITFAWAGPVTPGEKHYYRVQGPTFVIEFDNTQNNGNHIHSVWRDFDSDFGRDLLREHLAAVKH